MFIKSGRNMLRKLLPALFFSFFCNQNIFAADSSCVYGDADYFVGHGGDYANIATCLASAPVSSVPSGGYSYYYMPDSAVYRYSGYGVDFLSSLGMTWVDLPGVLGLGGTYITWPPISNLTDLMAIDPRSVPPPNQWYPMGNITFPKRLHGYSNIRKHYPDTSFSVQNPSVGSSVYLMSIRKVICYPSQLLLKSYLESFIYGSYGRTYKKDVSSFPGANCVLTFYVPPHEAFYFSDMQILLAYDFGASCIPDCKTNLAVAKTAITTNGKSLIANLAGSGIATAPCFQPYFCFTGQEASFQPVVNGVLLLGSVMSSVIVFRKKKPLGRDRRKLKLFFSSFFSCYLLLPRQLGYFPTKRWM